MTWKCTSAPRTAAIARPRWVNVGRLYSPDELSKNVVTNGTNEWQMRNQYRAWGRYMTGQEA